MFLFPHNFVIRRSAITYILLIILWTNEVNHKNHKKRGPRIKIETESVRVDRIRIPMVIVIYDIYSQSPNKEESKTKKESEIKPKKLVKIRFLQDMVKLILWKIQRHSITNRIKVFEELKKV